MTAEHGQRRQRAKFKKSQRNIAPRLIHDGKSCAQILIINHLTRNADTFVIAQQMRRGIDPRPPAGSA